MKVDTKKIAEWEPLVRAVASLTNGKQPDWKASGLSIETRTLICEIAATERVNEAAE